MTLDAEPMRTICPACDRYVDSYGDGDGSTKFAGQVYHSPCLNALPYPWCHNPDACRLRGYCTKDPNCGE